ncbi:uncharacterized protein [Trachinotus anak]|uniref:uncharacterized protein isoform X2 n=1 Tax=Trachinotus anak TaxID=443729 RepID=UPI0039F1A3F7
MTWCALISLLWALMASHDTYTRNTHSMACADIDMDIHGVDEEPQRPDRREQPVVQHYQATELVPEDKGPLHDLMQKQPAVLGSLQMVSGFLSVGVGILFAITQEMTQSLFTLFRVSHLTGALFFIAGIVSSLLLKYPALLPLSYGVNCGCIAVAGVAACLISVDLAHWNPENESHLRMEVMALCVLGLEVFLSAILCFWFSKEKRTKSS